MLYIRRERTITSFQRLFSYFLMIFSISYILAGCVTVPLLLVAKINANNNDTNTSPSQIPDGRAEQVQLRSSYRNLPVDEVQAMNHIKIRKKKKWGFYGYSTVSHDYVLKTINGNKVVIDHATGLMWHQSGSTYGMNWEKAKRWVRLLNIKGYAGYYDWRLPTVEEAALLLELSKENGRFIDPIFDKTQGWIWTGDSYRLDSAAWCVNFFSGFVDWDIYYYIFYYVRPVRTMK
ncbi:MAG: hypothetical protein SCARUB_02306 [Candidatus Scalindua rubra]|uniref:Lcl C-terminal domain-containing protein n=1 Tax=Candidatus Scalindua rubra TaxID=1872076 RepID=A0A1E3XA90_9BACT|nr:MAG: hypothetical protein SCARUB_02306 [Candidatus Scalindua rubra]